MIIKPRDVPSDLRLLRYLYLRAGLSEKEQQSYLNGEKGFEGEKRFDAMLEQLPSSVCLILSDLLFQWNNTYFQIDSLLVSNDKIYVFEIKNYEGDYYIEGDQWFSLSGNEINNPLQQLQRTESLLRQLLRSIRVTLPIESYVVFVNPEFTLFQAPRNLSVILPTQTNRFLQKLSKITPNLGQVHYDLVKKLSTLHITESPYTRVPSYQFQKLKKGIYCNKCHSFSLTLIERKLVCQCCRSEETVESGVMRAIKEYSELFPKRRITVQAINEWCGTGLTKRTIGWTMKKNLELVYKGGHSYYLLPDQN